MFKLSEKNGCFQYKVPQPEGEGLADIGASVLYGDRPGEIVDIHKKHLFEVLLNSGEVAYLWRLEFKVQVAMLDS